MQTIRSHVFDSNARRDHTGSESRAQWRAYCQFGASAPRHLAHNIAAPIRAAWFPPLDAAVGFPLAPRYRPSATIVALPGPLAASGAAVHFPSWGGDTVQSAVRTGHTIPGAHAP